MQFIDVHTHASTFHSEVFSIENKYPNSTDFSKPFSIGIHPWYISEKTLQNDLTSIEKHITSENCYALGECGLDKITKIDFSIQLYAFKQQIQLSEKYKKPLIIHCVKAYQEIIQLKKEIKPKLPWIVHGFNKNHQIALDLIKHNIYISFGKSILKNENLQQVFSKTPVNYIFLETDDKDISIQDVYKKASEIKNLELQTLTNNIRKNFNRIFKI